MASRLLFPQGMESREGAGAPGLHEVEALRRENEELRRRLESRKLIDRTIELEPNNGNRYVHRAGAQMKAGDLAGAQAVLLSEEQSQPRATT